MLNSENLVNLERWLCSEYEHLEYRFLQYLPNRARVVVILAAVLGVASANLAALGALAHILEATLHISDARFGLVGTVASLSGAVLTLIAGVWVDRRKRVRLLAIFAASWALGMAASGAIPGYLELLLAQVIVGASGISVGAVVASLTGDYFPPSQRGRIFGLIVGGELLGAGIGMLVASIVADLLGWRFAFWSLALLGLLGVVVIRRYLREPQRNTMERIASGSKSSSRSDAAAPRSHKVADLIRRMAIAPYPDRVMREDPTCWRWTLAARYIVTIRTNVILVLGSSASYFYFTGLLVFADLYLMQRFDLPADTASILFMGLGSGGIFGVLLSGWFADRLLHRHIVAARVWVAAGAFFLTVLAFLPAFLLHSVWVAAPCFFLAALFLGATNPTLDAARLDIMHSRLWGRAESIRNLVRYTLVGLAPLMIGLLVGYFQKSDGQGAEALGHAFLLLLVLLLTAGVAMVFAAFTYPRDVATVLASEGAPLSVTPDAEHPEVEVSA
ncbi:MFS transporter [Acidithiobacillus sp. AMEEHan]|uniref:MFS transporter n=1 Tax=Acidithiobacillus sp. AMEEHan TaxID=2994951 RepID=UPI0027E45201|nr:MFS transporter [Acidithiobacillus sp. AMEEHan]